MLEAIYGDWQYPWQFLLSTKKQKIIFHRHSHDENEEWWSLTSSEIPLNKWIHLVVTWNKEECKVFIYADGVEIAYRTFSSSAKFYSSSGRLYMVGNDQQDHQFQGSVMDLFVFGTALSLHEINKLRGERFAICSLAFFFFQARGVCEVIGIYSLLAEVCHGEAKMRGRREYPSFLSSMPRRERPLLAGKGIY